MTPKKISTVALLVGLAITIPSAINASTPWQSNLLSKEKKPAIADIPSSKRAPKLKDRRMDDPGTHYKSALFPISAELRPRVDFWKDVYTTYSTQEVIIHSSISPQIVYKIVNIAGKNGKRRSYSSRSIRRKIKSEKRKISATLKSIHKKKKTGRELSPQEKEMLSLLSIASKKNTDFLGESQKVRAQLGQKDRFVEGIRRSGRYIDRIREIFIEEGVPVELTVLPHVESSFNYNAYSSAGAMGIWQFMRSTGKIFMKVDYVIDERRDPLIATRGAAKLLKKNYKTLGNWPLAITAYNHGLQGMRRAQSKVGNNIVDVIDNHKSRYFGFASKNFYSEFMAALEIMQNPSRYFGPIELYTPIEYQTVTVDRYISIHTLAKALGLSKRELASYNPALRRPVIEGAKYVPKGYRLKVPNKANIDYKKLYASIPSTAKYAKQKPSEWYKVRRGDTLSGMAKRFRTSVPALMAMNDLGSVHRIYAGQILRVNGASKQRRGRTVATKTAAISTPPRKVKNDKLLANQRTSVKTPEVRERFSSKLYKFLSPANANAKNLGYGYIRIEPEETLGHYSEWSGTTAASLRRLNSIRKRKHPIVIGRKLKIPFNHVAKKIFEEKRAEYHLALQEDYFSSYQVKETVGYKMESGDTIWSISTKDDIPIWLLKWYNPEKNLHTLKAGATLTIPVVSPREAAAENS